MGEASHKATGAWLKNISELRKTILLGKQISSIPFFLPDNSVVCTKERNNAYTIRFNGIRAAGMMEIHKEPGKHTGCEGKTTTYVKSVPSGNITSQRGSAGSMKVFK
jgi:hypothetical protein